MSTSSRTAPEPLSSPAPQPFCYIEVDGHSSLTNGSVSAAGPGASAAAQAEQAARDVGRAEGEARARAFYEHQLQALRDGVQNCAAQFAAERSAYFEKVELEVVELALAIAHKILHREAQVDPLLLAGIVRVALEKLEDGTRVSIRVAPQQVSDWRSYFARSVDEHQVPEVVEDASLPSDQCVLKTELGTTVLGLEVQLKEVERGLMDLLSHRPAGTP
jgi:flagellar assembly protein FliH